MFTHGDRIGSRYVLDARVGSGAMGEVWRAEDDQGNRVAVKVLMPQLASNPDVVERFIQERRILTRIDDPHVVRVRDMVMESETLAIVMEFVDGPDLASSLRQRGPLGDRSAAVIGAGICRGLAAVHAANICHRDVKPANILLLPQGPDQLPAPRLTDFGVSKIVGDSTAAATALAGTPNYLAPELLTGHAPSPASDLYSFGVLLHEALTGRTPFTGTNAAVMNAHLHQTPLRPPEVGDRMWRVIATCLAKDPAGRPASALLLAEELEAIASGGPPLQFVTPMGWSSPAPAASGATVNWDSPVPPRRQPDRRGRLTVVLPGAAGRHPPT